MEAEFWHERWANGETAFDQTDAHWALDAHWAEVAPPESTVFVPLCGKTVDMVWLAERGHRVIGVELSEVAVAAFFADQDLTPSVRDVGALRMYESGAYELWAGDLFSLDPAVLAEVTAVYDRASIVALPPDLRQRYVEFLLAHLPGSASILAVTFDYDQTEMAGPPFSVPIEEVRHRFGPRYSLEVLAEAQVIEVEHRLRERGLTSLVEAVVALRPS